MFCHFDIWSAADFISSSVNGESLEPGGLEFHRALGLLNRLVLRIDLNFQAAFAIERLVADCARLDGEEKLRVSVLELGDLAVRRAVELESPEVLYVRPEFRNDLLQESRVPRNVIGEFGDEVLGSGLFRRLVHVEAEPAEVPEIVGHFLHLLPVAAVLELHAGGGGLLRVLHVLLDAREVGCGRAAEGEPLEEVAFGLVLDAVSVLGH